MNTALSRLFWLLFLIGGCSQTGLGQTTELSNPTVEAARLAVLELRVDDALRLSETLLQDDKTQVAGHYIRVLVLGVEAGFGQTPTQYDAFHEAANEFWNLARSGRAGLWNRFYAADIKLFQAVLYGRQERYAKSAFAGRSAYKLYSQILKDDSGFLPAYKGLGVCQAIIGSTPASYRWLLKLFGYRGTVIDGLANVRKGFDVSGSVGQESRMFFSIMDLYLNLDEMGGLAMMNRLSDDQPGNLLFAFVAHFANVSSRENAVAERFLTRAKSLFGNPPYYAIQLIHFYDAESRFYENRFDQAIALYTRFLEGYSGIDFQGRSRLRRGVAYEMTGQRSKAEDEYRSVDGHNLSEPDRATRADAKHLLANPMSDLEKELVRARNALDGGRFEECHAILKPLRDDAGLSPSVRLRATYYAGRADHEMGNLMEALRSYRQIVENSGSRGDRWAPWSRYYMGEIFEALGMPDEAILAYEDALSYSGDFPYKTSLHRRCKTGLDRLN